MIDISWLVEHGPCKKFTTGTNIPCPGSTDPAKKAMYILLAGRVDVLKKSAAGGTQVIASLLKGDVFGGREYFTEADDCTYVAGLDSAVYVITEESFNDLSWSRPEILFEILRAAYMPMRKMSAATRTAQQDKEVAAKAEAAKVAAAKATAKAAKEAADAKAEAEKAAQEGAAQVRAAAQKAVREATQAKATAKAAEQTPALGAAQDVAPEVVAFDV